MICVPILCLPNTTRVQKALYTRDRRLKADSSVWRLTENPGCERHYSIDCVPKRCPACRDQELSSWAGGPQHIATASTSPTSAVTVAIQSCRFTIGGEPAFGLVDFGNRRSVSAAIPGGDSALSSCRAGACRRPRPVVSSVQGVWRQCWRSRATMRAPRHPS